LRIRSFSSAKRFLRSAGVSSSFILAAALGGALVTLVGGRFTGVFLFGMSVLLLLLKVSLAKLAQP
jgi:hypothetical protein